MDFLLCAATFESHESAIRLIQSIQKLGANCLAVITGPIVTELEYIKMATLDIPRVLFLAPENSMYLCRNWGFVWAVHESISARYMASLDDDIEFRDESRGMIERMDEIRVDPTFSVLGFSCNSHHYTAWGGEDKGGMLRLNPTFVDGNMIFTQWEDNLQFGLPDSLPHEPMSYFSEVEFEHRLRILTGRPTVGEVSKQYWYWHYHRDELPRLRKRQISCAGGESTGVRLWKEKYGLDMGSFIWDAKTCYRALEELKGREEQMKKHMIFDGQWNDWGAIYASLEDKFLRIA